MLVANHFLHDTRVYKEARSLIEWGCEVHVIALYDPELPVGEEVDGILTHPLWWDFGRPCGDVGAAGVAYSSPITALGRSGRPSQAPTRR